MKHINAVHKAVEAYARNSIRHVVEAYAINTNQFKQYYVFLYT